MTNAGDAPPSETDAPLIFIIAGEASGDALGAGLMRALRDKTEGRVRFAGVGGEQMAAEGLASQFPISEMAVMGIVEILPKAPKLLRRVSEVVEAAWSMRPAAVVTIDSKAFTMRVQKRLRARREIAGGAGPRLIHWVPPTVWAWRPGRAKVIARFLDRLMTLFPFEPGYFEPHGLPATFVGHPAAARVLGNGQAFRARYRLPREAPILGVFPGSRPGEVGRLLPMFGETVARLAPRYAGLHVILPTVPVVAEQVRQGVEGWPVRVTLVTEHKHKADALAVCAVALAASGTVTLELTLAGVPTVVAYRVNALSAAIARRLVDPESVVLTNKLIGRRVVPQFLQEDCTPERLTVALERLFDDPRARSEQRAAAEAVRGMLLADGQDPSIRAAETVLAEIGTVDRCPES